MGIDLAQPPMSAAELAQTRSALDASLQREKRIYRLVLIMLGSGSLALGVNKMGMLIDGRQWLYLAGIIIALAVLVNVNLVADLRIGYLQKKRELLNSAEECAVFRRLCEKLQLLAQYRQDLHAIDRCMTLSESHAAWSWCCSDQKSRPATIGNRRFFSTENHRKQKENLTPSSE